MMNDVRFGWLGETRCAALHALLATQVNDWAGEWWVGVAAGAIDVLPVANTTKGNKDKRGLPLLSVHDTGSLAIRLGTKDFEALGCFLAGTASDEDAELAHRVGEDALTDLVARIHRRAGLNKPARLVREAAPLSLEHVRLGAFGVVISAGYLQMELTVDRALADRLVPPAITSNGHLVSRQYAIQRAPLRVVAMMDFGSVDLSHLSDLRVGEILAGDRKLDEALQIYLDGHGALATGFLRRLGEQRAVVLDGVKPQETSNHE